MFVISLDVEIDSRDVIQDAYGAHLGDCVRISKNTSAGYFWLWVAYSASMSVSGPYQGAFCSCIEYFMVFEFYCRLILTFLHILDFVVVVSLTGIDDEKAQTPLIRSECCRTS